MARTSKTLLTRSDYGERNKTRRKRGQERENKCLFKNYMLFFFEITGYIRKMTSKSSANLEILLFLFPVKANYRSKYMCKFVHSLIQ